MERWPTFLFADYEKWANFASKNRTCSILLGPAIG